MASPPVLRVFDMRSPQRRGSIALSVVKSETIRCSFDSVLARFTVSVSRKDYDVSSGSRKEKSL